ncbi:glutaredoxin [Sinobacterium caligoides]|uniref:Glutaredoxin n=1 Tax=Sinobacterium caligoides TaxID=933926 RepID=A0A3N2DYV8_9GAMM|nr:glutaredoxin domain-containing protein [Sinobacterium caligoides]ROS05056.1 glutaredoxin [Sinobacterium caligoides]
MKKIILFALVVLTIEMRHDIADLFDPPPPFDASKTKVVLYSASWCRYCAKVRALFDQYDVQYTEYDVEKSVRGKQGYDALGGGGIPITVINDGVVRGYDRDKIKQLLGH